MTPDQEAHLKKIKEQFALQVDLKYRSGQKEHGDNLYEMASMKVLNEAINEAVDLFVYLTTLKQQLLERHLNGQQV
jgi:hypothetical protein